jgi:hypothetical protein
VYKPIKARANTSETFLIFYGDYVVLRKEERQTNAIHLFIASTVVGKPNCTGHN